MGNAAAAAPWPGLDKCSLRVLPRKRARPLIAPLATARLTCPAPHPSPRHAHHAGTAIIATLLHRASGRIEAVERVSLVPRGR